MTERLSASNAAKHMACHGSADLEGAILGFEFPPEDDIRRASDEGSDRHDQMEQMLKLRTSDLGSMLRVLTYIHELRTTRRFNQLLEEEVTAWWLKKPVTTRVDVALYVQDELHIIDLKWGKIPVYATRNSQLKYYALAFTPLAPKAKGVWGHILQPRAGKGGNFDKVWYPAAELEEFRLESVATEAAILSGDKTLSPGDHCTFCPANPHSRSPKGTAMCPAMMQVLYPPIIDEAELLAGL